MFEGIDPEDFFWITPEIMGFPSPDQCPAAGPCVIGGDLHPLRLLLAYQQGIFPLNGPHEPVFWWAPDPRFVLLFEDLVVQKSMRPYFNQRKFRVTLDTCFEQVLHHCATVERPWHSSPWIDDRVRKGYTALYELGYAHSVEVWRGEELVGGLYGLSLGKIFFGESMFTRVSNASKFGLITLARTLEKKGFWFIDCQLWSDHLDQMGGSFLTRRFFLEVLARNRREKTFRGSWSDWEVADTWKRDENAPSLREAWDLGPKDW
ncbi:MAG: leucyl/phenylalanyl-tRNA--protein transferase [Bacteroidetes bacterium]|nr:MAG: leucyl/phenylalanyl-tRNA--protein transferase [Bacteroidota bacterium]